MPKPQYRNPAEPVIANVLALGSLLATVIAFVTAFSVLGSYDYANKFENGELPPGVDATAGQVAATMSVVAALIATGCLIGAVSVRFTKTVAATVVMVVLAAPIYGLAALFTVSLAF